MLSTPHPRPIGLPTSPRPRKIAYPTRNMPPELSPTSPVHSRPEYQIPSQPYLHTRSRSQPPRSRQPHTYGRSVSNANSLEVETYTDLIPHDEGDQRQLLSDSRAERGDGQYIQVPTSRGKVPLHPSRSPTSENFYPRSITSLRPDASSTSIAEVSPSGDGYANWSAVTNAASTLTISVSKAWSANITTSSGEETPPGQESRLMRAMKAYYIAKAQDTSELPGWLFDERESWAANIPAQPDYTVTDQNQTSLPQNGIRSSTTSSERWASSSAPHESTHARSRLRGTDRLKAMRDAMRGVEEQNTSEDFGGDNRQHAGLVNASQPTTQPRIGLPSGPQRGRR